MKTRPVPLHSYNALYDGLRAAGLRLELARAGSSPRCGQYLRIADPVAGLLQQRYVNPRGSALETVSLALLHDLRRLGVLPGAAAS